MQKVMLIGYLGRDVDLKYGASNTTIATFSVATTERWKDGNGDPKEHTEWFNIKAFGRRAEIAGQFLAKGSRIYLEGRKRTESWDDKQSGERKYRDFLYADKIEFLDTKGNGQGNGSAVGRGTGQQADAADPAVITDEDIPF